MADWLIFGIGVLVGAGLVICSIRFATVELEDNDENDSVGTASKPIIIASAGHVP